MVANGRDLLSQLYIIIGSKLRVHKSLCPEPHVILPSEPDFLAIFLNGDPCIIYSQSLTIFLVVKRSFDLIVMK